MRHRADFNTTTPLDPLARRVCRRDAAGRHARGTVLIVTMLVLLVLAGLALVLSRAMRVEGDCSANNVAAAQAAAIERGAIQYVLAAVDGLADRLAGAVPACIAARCARAAPASPPTS